MLKVKDQKWLYSMKNAIQANSFKVVENVKNN